jgi:hypothetical protein
MPEPLSDEKVARQILAVFAAHHMASGGTLRRNHFLTVRDGDFQRGLNKAVAKKVDQHCEARPLHVRAHKRRCYRNRGVSYAPQRNLIDSTRSNDEG